MIAEIEKALPWITEGVTVELDVDEKLKRFCDTVRLTHLGWRWNRSEDGESSVGGHDPVLIRIGTRVIVRGYILKKADNTIIHRKAFDPYFYAEQGDKVTISPSLKVRLSDA